MNKLILAFIALAIGFSMVGILVSAEEEMISPFQMRNCPATPSLICNSHLIVFKSNYIPSRYEEYNGMPCSGRIVEGFYLLETGVINSECEELYPSKSLITIKSNKEVLKNSLINGNIRFQGDECSSGIYLTDFVVSKQHLGIFKQMFK